MTDTTRIECGLGLLLAAAKRLRPADGYLTEDMPDDRAVNLVTSVGALRQFDFALRVAEREASQ